VEHALLDPTVQCLPVEAPISLLYTANHLQLEIQPLQAIGTAGTVQVG
jgi:hypothetical protein